MKKVIRLTESDLHRIVRNSVKRILEGKVLPGIDNGRDFEMTHPNGSYTLNYNKDTAARQNYNAQQRGETPNTWAGWEKRIPNKDGYGYTMGEFNPSDLNMYDDNDEENLGHASTTAQNLRQYDRNFPAHYDMFRAKHNPSK